MSALLVNTLTATISRLKLQLVEKDSTIEKLLSVQQEMEEQLFSVQQEMKEATIKDIQARSATILLADKKMAELLQQQRQLSASTLALSKQKKVKLVTAHTVTYTTEPRKVQRKEIAMSNQRLIEKQQTDTSRYKAPHPTNIKPQQAPSTGSQARKEGKDWISHIVGITDKLVKKYSIPMDKRRNMQYRKGKRPSIVPRYLASLWKLYLAPTPKPVQVPDPRPVVNWGQINHNVVRNLPKPVFCAVQGVSQSPTMYETKKKLCCISNRTETIESPFASSDAPFGQLRGLQTSHGIVCMPEVPIHGYVWSNEEAAWVIAANTG